jgi:quinol monooxygenase YgiN
MVIGTLSILPSPDRRVHVLEILRSIQGPVTTQRGCTGCHIYEEDGPEPAIVLVERWDTEEALETHLRSEHFRHLLGALELSASAPGVSFDHVSSTEGMELVERVLTSHTQTANR